MFASYTDLVRSVGTFLYGRRLYEAMAVWETDAALAAQSDLMADFATRLAGGEQGRLLHDPGRGVRPPEPGSNTASTLRRYANMKASATRDLTVGGAHLAAQAFKAGLVDECRLFVWPVIVGGGKPALPTGTRADLELLDERRFGNGVVHLRYRIGS